MINIEQIFKEVKEHKEKLRLEKLKQPCQILYPHYKIGYWTAFGYSPFTVTVISFNQCDGVYEYQMENNKYSILKTEDEITLSSD